MLKIRYIDRDRNLFIHEILTMTLKIQKIIFQSFYLLQQRQVPHWNDEDVKFLLSNLVLTKVVKENCKN